MREYLIFTLSASIAAMGDLAGHERRGTYTWPGRSALTGLLGAALGIRRDGDFSELDKLGIAIAMFESGIEGAFRDYHTIETIPSAKAKQPNSRPEALRIARGGTNTSITLRDYRTGVLCGIAIWGEHLEPLRDALERPVFTLYLGRKSCPLSSPLGPQIVQAETPDDAIRQTRMPFWTGKVTAKQLITDASDDDSHVEVRHDQAIDRSHWHFAARRVALRPIDISVAGGA